MPTPYQLDFFAELGKLFDLKAIYFTQREHDRQWNLHYDDPAYRKEFLNDNFIARWIQKKNPTFHFSNSIFKAALSDKSDFVIVNGTYWVPNVLIAIFFNKLRGKKVFFYGEPLFPAGRLSRFLKSLAFLPIKLFTDGIMGIGVKAIDSYRSYSYKRPIANIPYSIDATLFGKDKLDEKRAQYFRDKFNLGNRIVVLSSGALIHRKGMDTVIKAFQQLPSDVNAALVIIGDGPDKKVLEELSKGNKNIHFAGFLEKEDIPTIFGVADIFVFASRYDGWGLVINEAACSDLAIISNNSVGAVFNSLVDGRDAIICSDDDVDEYKNAMKDLIFCADKRKGLVDNIKHKKAEFSASGNAQLTYGFLSAFK